MERYAEALIDFESPPIVEVALSVAFQPLDLGVVQLVELWTSQFREHFPDVEEQPPYQMPIEAVDGQMAGSLFSFQLTPAPLVPRL